MESYPLMEIPENRKNSVIHELIHIIHKNVHGFVVYILDNYWKKQTYGLLNYNKVDNPAKKPKN